MRKSAVYGYARYGFATHHMLSEREGSLLEVSEMMRKKRYVEMQKACEKNMQLICDGNKKDMWYMVDMFLLSTFLCKRYTDYGKVIGMYGHGKEQMRILSDVIWLERHVDIKRSERWEIYLREKYECEMRYIKEVW